MNVFLNIIWFVFGGVMIAIEYLVSSVAMMVTIVGIPFGLQTLKLAMVALWPFGTKVTDGTWPSGCLAGIMNVIWWFVGGIPIALTHLLWGQLFCITISEISLGKQHFKLMKFAFFPFSSNVDM